MFIEPNTKMNMSNFYKLFKISSDTWQKRKKEVLLWATNFFFYEIVSRQTIIIIEQIAEVEPFPKDSAGRESTKEDVDKFYKALALKAVQGTTESTAVYKPASVMIRENAELIERKFGHRETTAAKYMNKALNNYTKFTDNCKWVWINGSTTLCELLTDEEVEELYLTQSEFAVDNCKKVAEALTSAKLTNCKHSVYKEMTRQAKETESILKSFFVPGIKEMIKKHPEKDASFIVMTFGKFEGQYILDEEMLEILKQAMKAE